MNYKGQYFLTNVLLKQIKGKPFSNEELTDFYTNTNGKLVACKNANGECEVEEFNKLISVWKFFNEETEVCDIKALDEEIFTWNNEIFEIKTDYISSGDDYYDLEIEANFFATCKTKEENFNRFVFVVDKEFGEDFRISVEEYSLGENDLLEWTDFMPCDKMFSKVTAEYIEKTLIKMIKEEKKATELIRHAKERD